MHHSEAAASAGEDPDRTAAVEALGAAGRALVEAVVRTRVGTAELRAAAEEIDRVTARLQQSSRRVRELPRPEGVRERHRLYSPLTGAGHPAAMPLRWSVDDDGVVHGRTRLGARFEGPPGLLHGGLTALVLDEALGAAVVHTGARALTGRLEVTYLAAIPLDEEMIVTARVAAVDGRKVAATAEIVLAAAPGAVVARASAVFVVPSPERALAYFGARVDAADLGGDAG